MARGGFDGVSRWIGMEWEHADTVRCEIRPDLINGAGLISINYVQTATEGEIVCTTKLDRRNRKLAVLRSEVHHEDGRLLATAIGSFTIFERKEKT
jgi:acyl-coenzyme A thioesterase PaaI-like protein